MSSPSPTSRWRQPAPFPPRSGTRDPITVPASQLPFPDVVAASRILPPSATVTPVISPATATEPLVAIPFQTWLQWQQELANRVPLSLAAPEHGQASLAMMYQRGPGSITPSGPPAGRGRRSNSVPRPPIDLSNNGYQPYTSQHPMQYQPGQVPYGTVSSAPPTYPPYYPPAMGNHYQQHVPSSRPVWLQQQQQQQHQHLGEPASSHSPTRSSTGTTTHPIRGLSSHPRPEVLDPLVSQLKKRRDPAPAPTTPKLSLSTAERYEWLAQYADRRAVVGPAPPGADNTNDESQRPAPASQRAGGASGTAHMHLPLGQPPPAFKPYTVTDYQAIKKADAVTRLPTSLGPPTDPESEARRAKAMAAHEYAERLRSMGSRQRSMTM